MQGRTAGRAASLRGMLVAGLMLLVCGVFAPAASATPVTGLTTGWKWHEGPAGWATSLAAQKAIGAQVIRTDLHWGEVQARRGAPLDWTKTDAIVGAMAAAGLRPWGLLSYSASWANSARTRMELPDDPAEYAAWGAAVAARYGSRGSFWSERRDLPFLPVQHYEVWNEQNAARYVADQATAPERYAALYATTRVAIKAVDPAASVSVGGLVTMGAVSFMERFVRAVPGGAAAVDEVGLHPYAAEATGAINEVRSFREALDRMGLRVPLVLTEAGFFPGSRAPAESFRALLEAVEDPDLRVTHLLAYSDNEWAIPGLQLRLGARGRLGAGVRVAGTAAKRKAMKRKARTRAAKVRARTRARSATSA